MKILRVAQKVYPEVTGGGPYHVHAMSRDQAAMGHNVTVLTVSDEVEEVSHQNKAGYTLVKHPATVSPLGNDISLPLARTLWNEYGYDVIHAHSHMYFSTNLAALRRRLGSPPLAITNHGLYSQNAPRAIFGLYLRTAGIWTFNSGDLVFCYTEEGMRRARKFGVKSDIEIVANGIDQQRFTSNGERSAEIDPDRPSVLCVVRLVEGKRPKDAIEAIEGVIDDHPSVVLYLCGEGPLRENLEGYIRREGIEDHVVFLGNVDYDEMPKLYRSCDVVILPSEAEAGSPRVLLEAMASEKPYVTSELYQVTSLIKDLGKTAPVGDIDSLAEGLDELLSDEELRNDLGIKGREMVEEQFTWESTVDGATEALERLVRREKR
ncbi:glycosyltransferase family 4 protein [Natronorarus salvus]|uniref:glycosyltransferase family 4 protein n=1 Tax=Natronorarus salvus TaxID=3117733 RepID=UPI002F2650CF